MQQAPPPTAPKLPLAPPVFSFRGGPLVGSPLCGKLTIIRKLWSKYSTAPAGRIPPVFDQLYAPQLVSGALTTANPLTLLDTSEEIILTTDCNFRLASSGFVFHGTATFRFLFLYLRILPYLQSRHPILLSWLKLITHGGTDWGMVIFSMMDRGSFEYVNDVLRITQWTAVSDPYYFRILVGTHKDLVPTCLTSQIRRFMERTKKTHYLHLLPAGVRELCYSYLPSEPVTAKEAEEKASSFGAPFIAIDAHCDADIDLLARLILRQSLTALKGMEEYRRAHAMPPLLATTQDRCRLS